MLPKGAGIETYLGFHCAENLLVPKASRCQNLPRSPIVFTKEMLGREIEPLEKPVDKSQPKIYRHKCLSGKETGGGSCRLVT